MCLGDGGKYDKHYDNEGGDDLRKLTCLVYCRRRGSRVGGASACSPMWSRGVMPVMLAVGRAEHIDELQPLTGEASASGFPVDIAPLGGRLLCFWSDKMVHGSCPSFAVSRRPTGGR